MWRFVRYRLMVPELFPHYQGSAVVILLLGLVAYLPLEAATTTTWDLAADWSDTQNPSGPWS